MVSRTLDLLYYASTEITATEKAIAIAMPEFVINTTDNENKHLRRHIVNLINNLNHYGLYISGSITQRELRPL